MEIEHLKEFLVFSQTLNYSTAAKELYIAQPTLSQHISKLSAEVGQPLVSREGSAHLTPAGNVLSLYAQSIIADYEKMMATFQELGERPESVIRIADVRISVDIAPEIRIVQDEHPDLPFRVEYVGDKSLFEKTEFAVLDEGLADVSFTISPDDYRQCFPPEVLGAYGFVPLHPLEVQVVLASRSPLAQKDALAASDLAQLNAVVVRTPFWQSSENSILTALQRLGVSPKVMTGSARSKWEVPACDLNFASFTFEDSVRLNPVVIRDGLSIRSLAGCDVSVRLYGIYRKDNPNPALPRFLGLWKDALAAED